MDNQAIIKKLQDLQLQMQILNEKIESKPKPAEAVKVNSKAIVDSCLTQCKKLLAPIKAQQTKEKKELKEAIKQMQNDVDGLKVETKKLKAEFKNALLKLNDDLKTTSIKQGKNTKAIINLESVTMEQAKDLRRSINAAISSFKEQLTLVDEKNKDAQKRLTGNLEAITKTAKIEVATAIDKKVNIDFINNLYRNR